MPAPRPENTAERLYDEWSKLMGTTACLGKKREDGYYECELHVSFVTTTSESGKKVRRAVIPPQVIPFAELPLEARANLAGATTANQIVPEYGGDRDKSRRFDPLPGLIAVKFVGRSVATPAKPRYARLAEQPDDPSKTAVSAIGSLTGTVGPLLRTKKPDDATSEPIISPEFPYRGERLHDAAGAGRVTVKQNMGSRADANIDFSIRKGTFGTRDTNVTTSKYQMNLNYLDGSQLQFGRFTFAQPANKISVSEEGDGLRYLARALRFPKTRRGTLNLGTPSLAHVVRRRSLTPFAEKDNKNAYSTILQLERIALPSSVWGQASPFRTLNLIAVKGKDQKFGDQHRFDSWGGEVLFALPQRKFATAKAPGGFFHGSGSAAFFANRRSAGTDPGTIRRHGNAWLTTFAVNRSERLAAVDAPRPIFTVSLTLGAGARDRTVDGIRIPGYVGESAGFAPDLIFLSSFAPAIENAITATTPEANVGRGLSNKRYTGVQVTWFEPKPLRVLLDEVLNVGTRINATSATVKLHDYRFRTPVAGSRYAGDELDLEILVEAPRGIKLTLSAGYFFRGSTLDEVIARKPWTVVVKLSLEP